MTELYNSKWARKTDVQFLLSLQNRTKISHKGSSYKLEEKNDTTSATQVSEQNSDDGDLIDEFVNDTSEVGDRLEKVLQNSPFLMKVWNLMKSWGHGNKAFRIIATLPLFHLPPNLPSDAGNIS